MQGMAQCGKNSEMLWLSAVMLSLYLSFLSIGWMALGRTISPFYSMSLAKSNLKSTGVSGFLVIFVTTPIYLC